MTGSMDGPFVVGPGTSCIALGILESSPGITSPARVKPGGHTTLLYFRPGRTGVVVLVGLAVAGAKIVTVVRGFLLYSPAAPVVLMLNSICSGTSSPCG
jgi:hypothetical protein